MPRVVWLHRRNCFSLTVLVTRRPCTRVVQLEIVYFNLSRLNVTLATTIDRRFTPAIKAPYNALHHHKPPTCNAHTGLRIEYQTDFFPPLAGSYARDESAYIAKDRLSIFGAMVIGRVMSTPLFSGGHCTFTMDGGESGHASQDVFVRQLRTLAVPVGDDDDIDCDNSANYRVLPWTDADRTTRSGGSYIELHLSHDGGSKTTVYTPVDGSDDLEIEVPRLAKDFSFRVGDWILALMYELLARHLRVFPQETFDWSHNTDAADVDDGTLSGPSSPEPGNLLPSMVLTICPSDLDNVASTTQADDADTAADDLPELLAAPVARQAEFRYRTPPPNELAPVPQTPAREERVTRVTPARTDPYPLRTRRNRW
ncbi:hypothetical protein C8R44DRAFT_878190 [Mycena epipterygia]|nr:hypothetical protein C8R44DRAFT_878190 [Mycena epipterygia]